MCGLTRPAEPRPLRRRGHGRPGRLPREPRAPIPEEQRSAADRRHVTTVQERRPWSLEPGDEPVQGDLADRDEALLVALADDAHERPVERQVLAIEADGLAHPQAGRVEQLEQRPVAHATLGGSLQQALHLADIERVGQAPALAGQVQVGRDVDVDEALAEREPVEALECGRATPEAGRGEAGLTPASSLGPRCEITHGRVGRTSPRTVPAQRTTEVREIAAVGADRGGRETPLDVEVREVVLDDPLERDGRHAGRSAPAEPTAAPPPRQASARSSSSRAEARAAGSPGPPPSIAASSTIRPSRSRRSTSVTVRPSRSRLAMR